MCPSWSRGSGGINKRPETERPPPTTQLVKLYLRVHSTFISCLIIDHRAFLMHRPKNSGRPAQAVQPWNIDVWKWDSCIITLPHCWCCCKWHGSQQSDIYICGSFRWEISDLMMSYIPIMVSTGTLSKTNLPSFELLVLQNLLEIKLTQPIEFKQIMNRLGCIGHNQYKLENLWHLLRSCLSTRTDPFLRWSRKKEALSALHQSHRRYCTFLNVCQMLDQT